MAKVPESARILNEILPASVISEMAREKGALRRRVKVNIVVLVWTVVLAPKSAAMVTLSAMQVLFESLSNATIAPSAFQARFSKAFTELMRGCVDYILERTGGLENVPALFKEFTDVLAVDSSLIKLPDCLAAIFPGPRNNTAPSAMKVNAVYSVVRSTMRKVAIAQGTKAEVKFLEVDKNMADTLLLFDLGYFCFGLFKRVDDVGAFFISRLKSNSNPRIVRDNTSGPGRRRSLQGLKLHQAIKSLGRDVLDVRGDARPK